VTESVPPASAAALPPDEQKALRDAQRVFQWLSEMPSPDIIGPVIVSLIHATNKLDGAPSSERDRELIAGWAHDLLSFLSCTQLFARGHLRAFAAKDDTGAEMLQFAVTTLGEKYMQANAPQPTPEENTSVGTDVVPAAS
jgi:hypothetical protein